MALTKKQAELDVDKWLKSEQAGHDLCGDFEFCAMCDKTLENPCAKAYDAMKKAAKPAAKKKTTRELIPSESKTDYVCCAIYYGRNCVGYWYLVFVVVHWWGRHNIHQHERIFIRNWCGKW